MPGGFAFYTWFSGDRAGDFALTLGGYHPDYRPPAHYPQVPRLAFNWQLTPEVSAKGDAYFALVPSTLMAGGHLQLLYQSGHLRAWLNVGADFLIAWKPYHYQAHAYVDIGVSYTYWLFGQHTLSIDVGADLSIWGPEFAGEARVHLWIVSFSVSFRPPQAPPPVTWDSFRTMLPENVLSVSVGAGLVKPSREAGHLGVVNPKDFVLLLESAVPISRLDGVTLSEPTSAFGIAPMWLGQADSTFSVTFRGENVPRWIVESHRKTQPSALWGTGGGGELTAPLLCGVTLSAPEPRAPGHTSAIRLSALNYEDADVTSAFARSPALKAGQAVTAPFASPAQLASLGLRFADWAPDDVDDAYRNELYLPAVRNA